MKLKAITCHSRIQENSIGLYNALKILMAHCVQMCGLDLDLMKICRVPQMSMRCELHRLYLLTEKYPVVRAVKRTPLNDCVHIFEKFHKRSKSFQYRFADCYESRQSNEFQ